MPRLRAELRIAVAVAAAIASMLWAASVPAQVFYKWTDEDGKVHYADKPPAKFKGAVTRIDAGGPSLDAPSNAESKSKAAPRVAPALALPDDKAEEEKGTINAKRRAERERLAARLEAARAKLEKARKALTEGDEPRDSERIYVQQRFERNERRPERTPPPHVNCMSQYATDGTPVWNCPRPIPTEAYYERQKSLEEAVRKAEEELAEAESQYRRGVD